MVQLLNYSLDNYFKGNSLIYMKYSTQRGYARKLQAAIDYLISNYELLEIMDAVQVLSSVLAELTDSAKRNRIGGLG